MPEIGASGSSRDHPELTAAVMLSASAGVVLDEVASEVNKGRSDLVQVIQNLVGFDAHIRSVGNFEYLPDNQAILDQLARLKVPVYQFLAHRHRAKQVRMLVTRAPIANHPPRPARETWHASTRSTADRRERIRRRVAVLPSR
jgi:hypothetical protein